MIELLNCFKSYDKEQTYVLKNLNLKVKSGEMIAIVGKSGSGKTTLLNILGSLDIMQKGSYTFIDYNVDKMSKNKLYNFRNQNLGFVFQDYFLIPYLSVLENVLVSVMHLKKKIYEERKEQALMILAEMNMSGIINRKARNLSGGEKQRVAIARALINNPKLILADEPTGNLDKDNEKIVLDELKRINFTNKVTIIIATHNEDIIELCDKIYILENGKLTHKPKVYI